MPTPKAYYNEFDPFAAAWLRELIKEGLIADGDVDTRSIREVQPADLQGYTQVHFFAGIGGWSLALRLAGWDDSRPVWTGSCPCQPFSLAGKQKGFTDDRHLWPHFKQLIQERRPPTVFGEQVASASAWLKLVRGDLEGLGYAVGAMPIQAASAGADHLRDRYWFVADDGSGRRSRSSEWESEQPWGAEAVGSSNLGDYTRIGRREGRAEHEVRSGRATTSGDGGSINLADTISQRRCGGLDQRRDAEHANPSGEAVCWVLGSDGKARPIKSGVRLLANGFPSRVDLLRGFGNAIDPRPASAFIKAAMTC